MLRVCMCVLWLPSGSGTMSGGGKPRKGGMSASVSSGGVVSEKDVLTAEGSLEEAVVRHKEVKEEKDRLATKVGTALCFPHYAVVNSVGANGTLFAYMERRRLSDFAHLACMTRKKVYC